MKKIYICISILFLTNILNAQKNECYKYVSDNSFLRYTAVGCQEVVNGNHSKAINESRKIANIIAENELAKMVNSKVTMVSEQMSLNGVDYLEKYADTTLVSSYKVFKGMKTVCQSKTELVGKTYYTYVTKEISVENIGDMLFFNDEKTKTEFRKLMEKNNK